MTSDVAVSIWREIVIGLSIPAQLVFNGERYFVIIPWEIWSPYHAITDKQISDLVALAHRFAQPHWDDFENEALIIGAARETA
jgi:hypothetical protein